MAALVLLGLGPTRTDAQVTLFDNLNALEGWIDESEFWLSASGPDVFFAQQFLMGDSTNLDQVSVKLVRLGNVSGSLAFELWRDDGSDRPLLPGNPDRMIAELGTISDVTQMSRNATTYTFDDLAIDLAANDKYWVVANYSGLFNPNGHTSIGWVHHIWPVYDGPHILAPAPEEYATTRGTIGTYGAAHARLYRDADPFWADYASVFGDEEAFFSMLVTALSPESLLGDYNGNGLVEQGDLDLVLLNWGEELTNPGDAGWTNDLPSGLIDQDELDRVLLGWGGSAPLSGGGGVPEPSSVVLGMVGLLAASAMGRRRR